LSAFAEACLYAGSSGLVPDAAELFLKRDGDEVNGGTGTNHDSLPLDVQSKSQTKNSQAEKPKKHFSSNRGPSGRVGAGRRDASSAHGAHTLARQASIGKG
jgi:hypothetical protein